MSEVVLVLVRLVALHHQARAEVVASRKEMAEVITVWMITMDWKSIKSRRTIWISPKFIMSMMFLSKLMTRRLSVLLKKLHSLHGGYS
jgi:hypothetical protein